MAETHFEPFLHLADVGPDRALVTWGGFWFHREDADADRPPFVLQSRFAVSGHTQEQGHLA